MKYVRMPIEAESPEELGYGKIRCNLAESSITDATLKELGIHLGDLVLAYGDHKGNPQLRELIAAQYPGINADDILITPGAAAALFIVATSLLEKEDHLVVQFPNYATNLATPETIGCDISKIELQFENSFQFETANVEKLIHAKTKLLSITTPHNPTGTMPDANQLQALLKIAEKKNIFLLADETYRDLTQGEKPPLAATLSENAISISSISKAYGLPGIRIGWIITKNKKLKELFLAAKEQIFICNSVVDEEIAAKFLQSPETRIAWIKKHIAANFSLVEKFMHNNSFLEWIKPSGGVVCFPRFKSEIKIDEKEFHKVLNEKHGTYVGPGHWFGMSDRYMRIGFGWPSAKELEEGLQHIISAFEETQLK
jgi:aspartate/methionine/tyrosine aminotransferase